MTREEAYRLAMRACEETWNEKICKQIKEALEPTTWVPCPDNDGERELLDRAVKALEAELATKTCNKQIVSKLENAELARDSEKTCNNKQVSCKLVASEDCISRRAMIYGLASIAKAKAKSDAQKSLIGRVMFFTEQLPPVTPKQRTGHWIECEDEVKCFCSECKEISDYPTKFCPNCGAWMIKQQESEG